MFNSHQPACSVVLHKKAEEEENDREAALKQVEELQEQLELEREECEILQETVEQYKRKLTVLEQRMAALEDTVNDVQRLVDQRQLQHESVHPTLSWWEVDREEIQLTRLR